MNISITRDIFTTAIVRWTGISTDGESAFVEIPVQRTISVVKMSRVIEMFMGVAIRSVRVMV